MNVAISAYPERTETVASFDPAEAVVELLLGNKKIRAVTPAIHALRVSSGQENDLTTDPEYFMTMNAGERRRSAVLLLRSRGELRGCVLCYEHTLLGIGLGMFRGGDYMGESLVIGPAALRTMLVGIATQSLLAYWRIHGVSLSIKASREECVAAMGPESDYRRFLGKTVQHALPLERTYAGMLSSFGPRTRRSLAGKRDQLERETHVQFLPGLSPDQAFEAAATLRTVSQPVRSSSFFEARCGMLRRRANFFAMGLRLPNEHWLSLLLGWRIEGVTYIDIQMNHALYKKESLSAVMRAFMIEHEIGLQQQRLNFVGGSSVLLERYCRPAEPCTEAFLWRPCVQARLFESIARFVRPGSVYERLGVRVEKPSLPEVPEQSRPYSA